MAIDVVTLALSKKYTKDTAEEFGAVKGAPCTVKSVTEIEGGHRVTLEWKNSSDVTQTTYFDVMDGADGNGVYMAYIVGSTAYAEDWLSFTSTGEPLVPTKDELYVILSEGDYQNLIFRWDEDEEEYIGVGGSGSGDAALESAVTSNLTVGAIASGTTLAQGTTFTEFVQKLLIQEVAPTISFSISKSGNVEVGDSYTETLTLAVTAMGSAKKIKTIAWYEGSTLLQTDTVDSTTTGSWTYVMATATTENTTFKAVVTYTKSDDNDTSVTKTASISFYYEKFYGGVSDLDPSEATVEALTGVLGTAKGGTYSFTVTAGRICYAYPKSLGALTSIKDGNGFSLFDSFTRTEQSYTQHGNTVAYYRYVLTDATTVSSYSVVFA